MTPDRGSCPARRASSQKGVTFCPLAAAKGGGYVHVPWVVNRHHSLILLASARRQPPKNLRRRYASESRGAGNALLAPERRRSIIWLMYSGDWVLRATKAYTTGTTYSVSNSENVTP